MPRRSVLFSPGDDAAKLRKALDSDADVVVYDLEDAVAPGAKPAARRTVREVLDDVLPADREVCVRVNPVGSGAGADLDVVLDGPSPDSVMLPKTSAAADVRKLRSMLRARGADRPVLALVESAAGVLRAEEIAAVDATDALVFGAEDLAGDIGATRTPTGSEVSHARQHVVLAARAAGVSPIDTPYLDFSDADGLRDETRTAIGLGYDGKLAIHPAQVPVINGAFAPDADEVAWAERVLDARDEADGGVFVVDGEMVDAPLVTQAERILARAGVDRE
ncbi:HpcH/HpaI aldolase/citrate lyase family protein [Haloarcula salina]|uniref:CoA ester lyase n=1 Tax=Haloarcula salina TaxID=1429914 RepID=A0AA41FZL5_9EURY|nr:CoA ester lyase [Haloarcula salina]MBV0900889.1 CoA ester lyase [Haloarcula salina]